MRVLRHALKLVPNLVVTMPVQNLAGSSHDLPCMGYNCRSCQAGLAEQTAAVAVCTLCQKLPDTGMLPKAALLGPLLRLRVPGLAVAVMALSMAAGGTKRLALTAPPCPRPWLGAWNTLG